MPVYAYDPRLVKVEDTYLYYLVWWISMEQQSVWLRLQISKTFTRIENPFLPFNRNAVLSRERSTVTS